MLLGGETYTSMDVVLASWDYQDTEEDVKDIVYG